MTIKNSMLKLYWPQPIIIGAACAFCWPVFLGRIMLPADMCLLMLPWRALQNQFPDFRQVYNPMFDPIQQYLPWRIYAVDSLRQGFVPLWNPYAFCGTPFLANLQSALLYPLNLLFLVTGARYGFGISAILHLSLGGLFQYTFLRALKLRQPAALLGALVFMFSGYTVTWLEFPTLSLWVYMWLPAILLCYEKALQKPCSLWIPACGLIIGIQFLGGHLQVSAYVIITFFIYVIVRALHYFTPSLRAERGKGGEVVALIALIVGLMIAAAQLLPTLELAHHTRRVAAAPGQILNTAFPITHFILYLVPNFFGNPVDYNYWGNYRDPSAINFFETACYVGILPIFLAAWSLRRWREQGTQYFMVLTAFAVLAAIGSPVYLLLYHLAPGFSQLAGLGRILSLAAFGLAGLAAVGLDDLLGKKEKRPIWLAVLIALVIFVCVGGAARAFQPLISALEPGWHFPAYLSKQLLLLAILTVAAATTISLRARIKLFPNLFSFLAIGLIIADLFSFGLRFNPFMPAQMAYPETEATRWLQQNAGHDRFTSLASSGLDWMPHNSPMIFGLRDIHGSDSLRVRRSFELVLPPGTEQANYPPPDSSLMDELGVRYLMTRRALSGKWKLVYDAEAPIYENTQVRPRVHFRSRRGGIPLPPERREPAEWLPYSGEIIFLRDDPDAITISVKTDRAGQLVLTDSYYPGWRAWVDGKPVEIHRDRETFRAIKVPQGSHTLEMRYGPASYRVGLFVTMLGLAVIVGRACLRPPRLCSG